MIDNINIRDKQALIYISNIAYQGATVNMWIFKLKDFSKSRQTLPEAVRKWR